MSTPKKIRRAEEVSLRIAVAVSLAFYGLLFGGLALLPHAAKAARGGEPAGVEVVLVSDPAGSYDPATAATPRGGSGAAGRGELPDRRGAPLAARAPAARDAATVGGGAGKAGGEAAKESGQGGPAAGSRSAGDAGPAAPESRDAAAAGGSGSGAAGTPELERIGATGGTGSTGSGTIAGDASPGRPGAAGRAESGASPLLDLIRERIERERSYPLAARIRGIEGTVTASITVDGQGELSAERVVRTSGSAILDRAGLALLRRVFPVPNDSGSGFDLEVRISYRLVDGGASE